jgi:SAM-dependent methyltransferase
MVLVITPTILLTVMLGMAAPPGQSREVASLFSPVDLGMLEGPDRDQWQQPERVMDVLGIADGSRVADLGAGGGWFTVRLGRRVGPNGRVYAQDIQPLMLDAIRRRVKAEGLTNVVPVLGAPTDPKLPHGLDAVLIVDTYPQISEPVALLENVVKSLRPADGSASSTSRRMAPAGQDLRRQIGSNPT